MAIRIGVDTGGTFTDIVAYDEAANELFFHKVCSTPENPADAVVIGVQQSLVRIGRRGSEVDLFVHGTTVATNALLQRRGARVALITTSGFRDVLHIQRQNRPRLYDLRSRRAAPLIPRKLRFEIRERIKFDGSVELPPNLEDLERAVEVIEKEKVDAVAVAFLHSHTNPSHELLVANVLRKRMPLLCVCTSQELVKQVGEYERFSTCSVNAYVQPSVQRYLEILTNDLHAISARAPLMVMKSSGGVSPASVVARECVETILSGPAGGVVAGIHIARHHSNSNLITADMGGTSFDVAVIQNAKADFHNDADFEGIAVRAPMLDVHTVGAGGGSIGWIDAGGALRVGPVSAGALPGPVCYGRGGVEPTVSDANLVLGRLSAQSEIAGELVLDCDGARRAIQNTLAAPLGISIEAAAEGMIRVANATMVAAIRKLTVERGIDPRQFVLCGFGGAGPLHCAELARECGIRQLLIPSAPGLVSAMGLLMSNLREDIVTTKIGRLDEIDVAELRALLDDARSAAVNRISNNFTNGTIRCATQSLAVRYVGQSYDLPIEVVGEEIDIPSISSIFHNAHEQMYGFSRPDYPLEMVRLWASVEIDIKPLRLPRARVGTEPLTRSSSRAVVFDGESIDTPVYNRSILGVGCEFIGPAIVEQADSTTVIWPNDRVVVDEYGQLVVSVG